MNASSLHHALWIFLCSFCLCSAGPAWSNGHERLLQLGDAAYSRKAYDSAVSYYSQAARGKTPDAVALYKLGNAHYRLKHTGEAVLAYERALLQRPGFAPAARNVHVIQQQVAPADRKPVFFIRWWRSITATELSNTWAVLAILIFAGILSVLGWSQYRRARPAWLGPRVVTTALIAAVICVIFSLSGVWRNKPAGLAVIMRPDAKFRPAGNAKSGGISLPEGLVVKVLGKEKEDLMVSLPDGQQGFVQPFDIAIVE